MQRRRISTRSYEAGATAVEYSLMVALIAGVISLTVAGVGAKVFNLFNSVTLWPW